MGDTDYLEAVVAVIAAATATRRTGGYDGGRCTIMRALKRFDKIPGPVLLRRTDFRWYSHEFTVKKSSTSSSHPVLRDFGKVSLLPASNLGPSCRRALVNVC